MIIREANRSDITQWARMRFQLWPSNENEHITEIEAYFNGNSNDIVQSYVLENDDDNLIGFIELNIRNYAESSNSNKVPYIEGWYVKPDFQNMGFGTKLIQKAEEWAKSLNFNEIASDAEIENEQSITAHKKVRI